MRQGTLIKKMEVHHRTKLHHAREVHRLAELEFNKELQCLKMDYDQRLKQKDLQMASLTSTVRQLRESGKKDQQGGAASTAQHEHIETLQQESRRWKAEAQRTAHARRVISSFSKP